MNCTFIQAEPHKAVCTVCGRTVATTNAANVVASCRGEQSDWPKPSQPLVRVGPGTELKRLLSRFRISAQGSCGCEAKARLMDEMGPDWCIEHIEKILDWLSENAAKRKLPFIRFAARLLVRRAVSNARRKLAILERATT
jgi:hypothetical protein